VSSSYDKETSFWLYANVAWLFTKSMSKMRIYHGSNLSEIYDIAIVVMRRVSEDDAKRNNIEQKTDSSLFSRVIF
jgi:hypothetical protein